MFDEDIKELGFEEEEINAIWLHFEYRLKYEDWESIIFVEEEDDDDNYFKLPTGRMVYFPDELIRKEILQQID